MLDMETKNLLLVNHYLTGKGGAGGSRHFDLARELVRRGWKVTLVGARTSSWLGIFGAPRKETHDGVDFLWYPTPLYAGNGIGRFTNMIWFALRAFLLGKGSLAGVPTVVVGSTVHPLAALAALGVAWRWRLPFVFEVRDIWPQSLVDLGRLSERHLATRILNWIESILLRNAREVITLLPTSEAYLVSKGARPGNISYIPNGVDFTLLKHTPPVEKRTGELRLMYLGSHGEAHSLHHIVMAAKKIKEDTTFDGASISFDFYGEGPEKRRLIDLAAKYELGNVRFRPAVPKQEISSVAADADGFILNMPEAGVFKHGISPNKLFDYMAFGRPVLFCCNSKFNPVRDANAGLSVEPESPTALVEAISELLRMGHAQRLAMGARGLQYVQAGHDVIGLGARFGEVLDRAIGDGNG